MAYGVLAGVCLNLREVDAVLPGVWFPSGLMVALALRGGPALLPGLWVGASLVDALMVPGSLWHHALLGLAACLEPLAVILLAHLWSRSLDPLGRLRDWVGWMGAAFLGVLVSLAVTGWLRPAGSQPPMQFLLHFTGVAALAPVLLALPAPGNRAGIRAVLAELRRPDWWALLLALTLSGVLINAGWLPELRLTPFALAFPLLLVGAFRCSPPAATALLLLTTLLQTWVPHFGEHGLLHPDDLLSRTTLARLLCGLLLVVLTVLVTNQEQRRLRERLQRQTRQLEQIVAVRTRELTAANARLERLSLQDSLTGLANRRCFEDTLAVEWQRAHRLGQPLTLGLLDVDGFKAYNDHYGHPAGDRCLVGIAAAVAGSLQRRGDLVARYGGEEFVVLLPGLSADAVGPLGEMLRSSVSALGLPHAQGGPEGIVTISLGLATAIPGDGITPEDLLTAADALLYRAKNEGRNRVCLASLPL